MGLSLHFCPTHRGPSCPPSWNPHGCAVASRTPLRTEAAAEEDASGERGEWRATSSGTLRLQAGPLPPTLQRARTPPLRDHLTAPHPEGLPEKGLEFTALPGGFVPLPHEMRDPDPRQGPPLGAGHPRPNPSRLGFSAVPSPTLLPIRTADPFLWSVSAALGPQRSLCHTLPAYNSPSGLTLRAQLEPSKALVPPHLLHWPQPRHRAHPSAL